MLTNTMVHFYLRQLNSRALLIRVCTFVLLGAIAFALFPMAASAQSTPEPVEEEGAVTEANTDDVNTDAITDNQVREVARTLWCPLCSGVRLDSCELKACEQMREEIAIMLAEGEDRETIRAQFVNLYGPQVLGEPPREGWNWLAWLLPFVALAAGGGFIVSRARQMMRPSKPTPADSGTLTTNVPADDGTTEQDEYERKLEDELETYG